MTRLHELLNALIAIPECYLQPKQNVIFLDNEVEINTVDMLDEPYTLISSTCTSKLFSESEIQNLQAAVSEKKRSRQTLFDYIFKIIHLLQPIVNDKLHLESDRLAEVTQTLTDFFINLQRLLNLKAPASLAIPYLPNNSSILGLVNPYFGGKLCTCGQIIINQFKPKFSAMIIPSSFDEFDAALVQNIINDIMIEHQNITKPLCSIPSAPSSPTLDAAVNNAPESSPTLCNDVTQLATNFAAMCAFFTPAMKLDDDENEEHNEEAYSMFTEDLF